MVNTRNELIENADNEYPNQICHGPLSVSAEP